MEKIKIIGVCFFLLCLVGCAAEIKPMVLPPYNPPDLSALKRPDIPVPIEGKDYVIDKAAGTVTYTISGQDELTAEVISEKTAWLQVDMLKQLVGLQQKDQLIITIDLKRQYAEKEKLYGDIEKYAAELIAVIFTGIALAR